MRAKLYRGWSLFQVSYFIAKRLRTYNKYAFSVVVHKIGIVSVALGLATTLITWMVMLGFQKKIVKNITNFCGDLQICNNVAPRSSNISPINAQQVAFIQTKLPHMIHKLHAFAYTTILLQTKVGIEGMICKGLDAGVVHDNLQGYVQQGRFINFEQIASKYSCEILISRSIASKLHLQVGDEVVVAVIQSTPCYKKLKIVGIYETYITDLESNIILCDIRLVQRFNNWESNLVNGYEVFLNPIYSVQEAMLHILDQLDYNFKIQSTTKYYITLYNWLVIIRKNTLLFIVFILIIAVFTMISVVMIQIMERMNMISMLKVLGVSNKNIWSIMLLNSLYTLVYGMAGGNILGLGISALQLHYKWIKLDPTCYYINYVPILWNWRMIIIINLLTFCTIMLVISCTIMIISNKKQIAKVLA